MNIRESIAKSLNSTHLETQEWETAIDRIGAFAHGTKLGRLLWRWKYNLEDWRAKAVLDELLIKASRKFGIAQRKRDYPRLVAVCEQALVEWYYDRCLVCRGAGELRRGDRLVECPTCQGSAVKRWSSHTRAQHIGGDDFRVWEKRLADTHGILSANESRTSGEMRYQLRFEAGEIVERNRLTAV